MNSESTIPPGLSTEFNDAYHNMITSSFGQPLTPPFSPLESPQLEPEVQAVPPSPFHYEEELALRETIAEQNRQDLERSLGEPVLDMVHISGVSEDAQRIRLQEEFAVENPVLSDEDMAKATYISQLAASTGRTLTSHDRLHLLGLSRIDINKWFFAQPVQQKLDLPVDGIEGLSSAMTGELKRLAKAELTAHKESIAHLKERIVERYKSIDQNLKDIGRQVECIETLENREHNFKPIIDLALANPFYTLEGIDVTSRKVTFISQNVVIRYKVPAHSIDMAVNFGQVKVIWHILDRKVKVYGYKDNINLEGYIHPHISSSNDVCWGNAGNTVVDAFINYDIAKVLTVLQNLMQTYNETSPYVRLEEFFLIQNPHLMQGEKEWKLVQKEWVFDSYIEHSVATFDQSELEDQDGDLQPARYISTYAEFNKKYGVRISEKLYYRSNNNKYFELDEEALCPS